MSRRAMSDDHELSAIDPGFDMDEFQGSGAGQGGGEGVEAPVIDRDVTRPLPASVVLEATRSMERVAWARLALDGVVLDANRGFTALLGLKAALGTATAASFVAPTLAELDGLAIHPFRGRLTLHDEDGRPVALTADVHRIGRQLLIIGELDTSAIAQGHRRGAAADRPLEPIRG